MTNVPGTILLLLTSLASAGEVLATSLLEAAKESAPITFKVEGDFKVDSFRDGEETGRLRLFWKKHQYHVLTVFAMQEADYTYASRFGTSTEPRLFSSVPGLDASVQEKLGGDEINTFVVQNQKMVLRGLALGAILATNRKDWWGTAEDLIGLIEAQKFNEGATSLVKNVVGRRRPSRGDSDTAPGDRQSFYSLAASQAFTYVTYIDHILAPRLKSHPVLRVSASAGLYGLAGYIAYSRLRAGEHYLTDVMAGAGAGFLVGHVFHRVNHRSGREEGSSRFRLNPPVPLPGGAFLSVSIAMGRNPVAQEAFRTSP